MGVVAALTVGALAAGVVAVLDDGPGSVAPDPGRQQEAAPASPAFVPRELGSSVGAMRVTGWVQGRAVVESGSEDVGEPTSIGSFAADIAGSDRVDVATQLTETSCSGDASPAIVRMQLMDGSSIVASGQVTLPQGAQVGAMATSSLTVPAASATRPLTVRVALDNCASGRGGDGFAVRVAATRLAT